MKGGGGNNLSTLNYFIAHLGNMFFISCGLISEGLYSTFICWLFKSEYTFVIPFSSLTFSSILLEQALHETEGTLKVAISISYLLKGLVILIAFQKKKYLF